MLTSVASLISFEKCYTAAHRLTAHRCCDVPMLYDIKVRNIGEQKKCCTSRLECSSTIQLRFVLFYERNY